MNLIKGNKYYILPCKQYSIYVYETKKHFIFEDGIKLNKNKNHLIFYSKRDAFQFILSQKKESLEEKHFRIWEKKILKKYQREYDIFKNIYIATEFYKNTKYHVLWVKYDSRLVDGFYRTGLIVVSEKFKPLKDGLFY